MDIRLVQDLSEFELIEILARELPQLRRQGVVSVGDDCAVIPLEGSFNSIPKESLVVTTDSLVEGIHFKREWSTGSDVGWKLLAVSLSDIASMGARPLSAVVSLQLPPETPLLWVVDCYRGLAEIAGLFSVDVVGGNVTEAHELSLSLTLIGGVEKPFLRSGAQVGDSVWVSGTIGLGVLGLEALKQGITLSETEPVQKYRRPHPRVSLGLELAKAGVVTAAIDISDGLFQDAGHIAKQSGVDIELELDVIPFPEGVQRKDNDSVRLLVGGDDYELLFFVAADREKDFLSSMPAIAASGGCNLKRIGQVSEVRSSDKVPAVSVSGDQVPSQLVKQYVSSTKCCLGEGFQHFRGKGKF